MGRRGGFTLIELLVVIGICGLLLVISFSALTRFRDSIWLEATARLTVMELRKTQALAMCRNESLGCNGFTFSRTGSALPGGSGTKILAGRFGGTKKIVLSPIGRVRVE